MENDKRILDYATVPGRISLVRFSGAIFVVIVASLVVLGLWLPESTKYALDGPTTQTFGFFYYMRSSWSSEPPSATRAWSINYPALTLSIAITMIDALAAAWCVRKLCRRPETM
jgi:hypothetical protein